MERKIFISFLGSTNYGECYYVKDNYKSKRVRYIQEATLEYLNADKWSDNSKALILVTEGKNGSFNKNWKDDGQITYDTKQTIFQPGLQTQLSKLNLPFNCSNIKIKDGNSEEEIWDIFETIYNLLEENDELYIDITHGFRYLPMLSIVLSNYGKLLKNISIKSITYGNFEARNEIDEAPIIDLTSFSHLQDWTIAANDFVNFGSVIKLTEVSKKDIQPLARKFKETNETVKSLSKISKLLPEFTANIETCRGKSIIKNADGVQINNELKNVKENFIAPLTPILNKIEDKMYPFSKEDDLINGFNAVNWCIKNNLSQQGFTILQENIISVVCNELDLDKNNIQQRNIVSSCFAIKKLNINQPDWNGDAKKDAELTKFILNKSKLIDLLLSDYYYITNVRNDLNHSGYNDGPIKSGKMSELLTKFYFNIIEKLQLPID